MMRGPVLLRPDSSNQADILADAAFGLIAEGGVGALTMRAVAGEARMSPAWLVDRFGGRDRMLFITATVLGRRWLEWVESRWQQDGVLALLPGDDDEVVATRVWLAIEELGRVQQDVAWRTADVRAEERAMVAHLYGARVPPAGLDPSRLDAVMATVEGLRAGIAALTSPLSPARARRALQILVSTVDPGG